MERNRTEYVQAKEYALRSLTCLEQSEFQIRQKLSRKKYTEKTIDEVLLFLKQYDFVNDQRFTEQYVASHCQRLNRRQILDKLYMKGIRQAEIDDYLELYQYDEEQILKRAVEKYMNSHDMAKDGQYDKCIIYFMQKGYAYAMIKSVLIQTAIVQEE